MDIQEYFRTMDGDNRGYLTKDELKRAMVHSRNGTSSEKELDDFINEADTNKDGKISLQEWLDSFVGFYD